MGIGFLGLLLYYRSQGGYKIITLGGNEEEEDAYEAASTAEAPAEAEASSDEADSGEE